MSSRYVFTCDQCRKEVPSLLDRLTVKISSKGDYAPIHEEKDFCNFECATRWFAERASMRLARKENERAKL